MIFKGVGCLVSSPSRVVIGSGVYALGLAEVYSSDEYARIVIIVLSHLLLGLFVVAKKERGFLLGLSNILAKASGLFAIAAGVLFSLLIIPPFMGFDRAVMYRPGITARTDMGFLAAIPFFICCFPSFIVCLAFHYLAMTAFPGDASLIGDSAE